MPACEPAGALVDDVAGRRSSAWEGWPPRLGQTCEPPLGTVRNPGLRHDLWCRYAVREATARQATVAGLLWFHDTHCRYARPRRV